MKMFLCAEVCLIKTGEEPFRFFKAAVIKMKKPERVSTLLFYSLLNSELTHLFFKFVDVMTPYFSPWTSSQFTFGINMRLHL